MAVLLVAATACSGSRAGDSGTGPSSATSAPPPSTVTLPPPTRRYQRPPQFVMVSFDGSGDPKLWRHWRAVGARTGARFSFFLSGVYLLDRAQARTLPPAPPPGRQLRHRLQPERGGGARAGAADRPRLRRGARDRDALQRPLLRALPRQHQHLEQARLAARDRPVPQADAPRRPGRSRQRDPRRPHALPAGPPWPALPGAAVGGHDLRHQPGRPAGRLAATARRHLELPPGADQAGRHALAVALDGLQLLRQPVRRADRVAAPLPCPCRRRLRQLHAVLPRQLPR